MSFLPRSWGNSLLIIKKHILLSSSSSSSSSNHCRHHSRQNSTMAPPRPSSSVVLLSPTNQVLLLHRVTTSTSFASAHVFPGGNLDAFHDGDVPGEESAGRHRDGPAYRMAAIRECFEETGLLLATETDKKEKLLQIAEEGRDVARKSVHSREVKFGEWLKSVGGTPDTQNLIPWTRWLTPTNLPKRFTTQMYLYLLPITNSPMPPSYLIPTPDNGVEHTAALFASPQHFLDEAAAGKIILFPPQHYLLTLLTKFTNPTSSSATSPSSAPDYQAQRDRLLEFLRKTPTAETEKGKSHQTAAIPWAEKMMSPATLFVRQADKRVVLGIDKPGPELKDSDRGGDWERVMFVRFTKGGPMEVEVRGREEAFEEERQQKASTANL